MKLVRWFKNKKWGKKKIAITTGAAVVLIGVGFGFFYTRVFGEQSGSSPTSASTSRIKTLSDALIALGYGSTSAGAWGDWGVMWNRIYSSAIRTPGADLSSMYNGTGAGSANCTDTFALNCYTLAKGGVDDYNGGGTIPSDAYQVTWTTCNSGNSYCSTDRTVAEKKDPNTGLVWSPQISASSNWFVANNCKYPNLLPGGDGTCNTNGEIACYCVKLTSSKTGCEAYDDGNWRLPYQKELMQSYIDGSWANLTNAYSYYWSSTTGSGTTQDAWYMGQGNGGTAGYTKTGTGSVRCVR